MENKKSKNNIKIVLLIIIILGILLVGSGTYLYLGKDNKEETKKEEQAPRLEDDFYESINYETLKNAKIPSDSSEWSHFYEVSKKIEERVDTLTEEILADPNYKNPDIDAFIELFNDYETRNKLGISELKPYLDKVDNAKTIEELNKVLVELDKDLDVSPIVTYSSDADIDNPEKNIMEIDQITLLGAPTSYYAKTKYKNLLTKAQKMIVNEYKVLGYSDEKANKIFNEVYEFAKMLDEKSIDMEKVTDIKEIYKKYTFNDITKEIKNLPIKQIFEGRKVDKEENYIVPDMEHLKTLDNYYTNEHIELFKEITKFAIIDEYLPMTTEENEQIQLDFMNDISGYTTTKEKYREDSVKSIKKSYIEDEIEKRYEEKYFTDEDKKIVEDLAKEIKEYYKEVINNSDWLSDETRKEAIKKLDAMKIKVGRQEKANKEDDHVKVITKSQGGTLISNTINANKNNYNKYSEELHKTADDSDISTLEVNAFYNSVDNSINFLAGFKGLYENETNRYRMMGYFGTVIAHEISHAFDSNGSQFDENGKLNNWWTEKDKQNYDQITKKIEEYYSKYEYMGFKVDGKLTLPENIADLGAMKAIISIAEKDGATNDDFKNIFEGYADLWAKKENKESAEMSIISDSHSPNKVRVNAVLSSMDKFYEVYDIKEGDKMFIPKEDRVSLW